MKPVVLALLLIAPTMSRAATPSERVERFLQQITTPQSDQAVDQLLEGSEFAKQKPDEVAQIKSQTLVSMRLAGKLIAVEKVLESDLTPSVKRLVYVQKFETHPGVWDFYFYKPHDEWQVTAINFTDQAASIPGSGR